MTLIVSLVGENSIWLLADRRLSFKSGKPKDDARKIMLLDCSDGKAIIGYAGLGATTLGTEPSDWISNVLRGRNLPLEQCLVILGEAMKKQFPEHMAKMHGPSDPSHIFLISAMLKDKMLHYSIDLAFAPSKKDNSVRLNCYCDKSLMKKNIFRTPRILKTGSGAIYLDKCKTWYRPLINIVKAYDRGKVSSLAVADHLANINYKVHLGIKDKSVGPKCIVAWMNNGFNKIKGGNGHQFYTNTKRDSCTTALPTISLGADIRAIADTLKKQQQELTKDKTIGEILREPDMDKLKEMLSNILIPDKDELNEKLSRLPDKPDEKLR